MILNPPSIINQCLINITLILINDISIYRKEHGTLRQMSTEKLVKTLPTLQNQLDGLLDFECSTADLNNGVINSAFMLLFRDLIRLFACYNDGIINLLGKDILKANFNIENHTIVSTYQYFSVKLKSKQTTCEREI